MMTAEDIEKLKADSKSFGETVKKSEKIDRVFYCIYNSEDVYEPLGTKIREK